MEKPVAREFAEHWIAAWNSHDLDRIMAHYADDFSMASPVIRVIAEEASGVLKGKTRVREYWQKALDRTPDLKFELLDVFTGVNSLVICYRGHRGPGAEVFHFDGDGKVVRAFAHYL